MKILYKLLAIYSLIVLAFLAYVTFQFQMTYIWGSYEYLVGKFTLIPIVILAIWSFLRK